MSIVKSVVILVEPTAVASLSHSSSTFVYSMVGLMQYSMPAGSSTTAVTCHYY